MATTPTINPLYRRYIVVRHSDATGAMEYYGVSTEGSKADEWADAQRKIDGDDYAYNVVEVNRLEIERG